MNENRNETIKVGLFVVAGLVIFAASIILIGGDKFLFKDHYNLNVKFDQIQGLSTGSVVSYSGITIGNVSSVNVAKDNGGIVLGLKLDQEYQNIITESAIASVRTQGALGDKYIYIQPGDLNAKALKENEFLTTDTGGDIMDMLLKKGDELSKVIKTAEELTKIFQQINAEGRAGSIAKHLDQLLVESTKLVSDVRGKGELSNSLAKLESILLKIDQSQGTIGALINDPTVHRQLVKLLGGKKRNNYLKPLIRATITNQGDEPTRK